MIARSDVLGIIDRVQKVARGARSDPRHGVTEREAALYDKGFDDALEAVRDGLALIPSKTSKQG